MNPFDFVGPQFLLFFLIFSAIVIGLAYVIRMILESYEIPPRLLQELAEDPYTIAFLHGGKTHLLSVTALSLLDRNLLNANGNKLHTTGGQHSVDIARRPVEQAVLRCCMIPHTMSQVNNDGNVSLISERITGMLRAKGLVPDTTDWLRRTAIVGSGLVLLWGVSLTKINIAFARGHHNIIFLLILSIVASIFLLAITLRNRTTTGDTLLKRLEAMFASLRYRSTNITHLGGETNQLALLASVFGFGVLSPTIASQLRPLQIGTYGSSDGGSGGSSCSGGGSSCGGGGCGGGCGGCG